MYSISIDHISLKANKWSINSRTETRFGISPDILFGLATYFRSSLLNPMPWSISSKLGMVRAGQRTSDFSKSVLSSPWGSTKSLPLLLSWVAIVNALHEKTLMKYPCHFVIQLIIITNTLYRKWTAQHNSTAHSRAEQNSVWMRVGVRSFNIYLLFNFIHCILYRTVWFSFEFLILCLDSFIINLNEMIIHQKNYKTVKRGHNHNRIHHHVTLTLR